MQPRQLSLGPRNTALRLLSLLILGCCACFVFAEEPAIVIRIDGDLRDWKNVPVLGRDAEWDAAEGASDLLSVSLWHDEEFLYLRITAAGRPDEQPIRSFRNCVYLDTDGDPSTGYAPAPYTLRRFGAEVLIQGEAALDQREGKFNGGEIKGLLVRALGDENKDIEMSLSRSAKFTDGSPIFHAHRVSLVITASVDQPPTGEVRDALPDAPEVLHYRIKDAPRPSAP